MKQWIWVMVHTSDIIAQIAITSIDWHLIN